jgi:Domain of unknown function (DUF4157)
MSRSVTTGKQVTHAKRTGTAPTPAPPVAIVGHAAPAAPEWGVPVPGLSGPEAQPGTPVVQRKGGGFADPLGGTQAGPDVVSALHRRRGRGAQLDQSVQATFGQAMGADFSGVRVHTDTEADHIARSVQATAFTQGNDVYFSAGSYAPATSAGQHLLAHELTHVVQQQAGVDTAGTGTTIGRADDPLETHAEANADRVLSALRRRASSGPGEHRHEPHAALSGRIARTAALAGGAIRRVITDGKKIATVATKIANGHAFQKHVTEGKEFSNVTSVATFKSHIENVIKAPTESKDLSDGRSAYWDASTGTIVIVNPRAGDQGTCFVPSSGKSYYNRQV